VKKKYVIKLDGSGIDEMLGDIDIRKQWLKDKTDELAKELAEHGLSVAKIIISNHVFNGDTLNGARVEQVDIGKYVLKVESTAILALEFGTGLKGFGHPLGAYGGGSFPGAGHWSDPNGWWFQTDDSRLKIAENKEGVGFGHSYGMPPAMPMYTAHKSIEQNIETIAKAVLSR